MAKLITINTELIKDNMGVNDLVYLETTGRYLRLKRDASIGDRRLKGVFDDDANRGSQDWSVVDKVD